MVQQNFAPLHHATTAQHAVHMLVTELAVFVLLTAKCGSPKLPTGGFSHRAQSKTEARFEVAADLNTQRGDL